jgi:hypothetical protein
MLNLLFANWRTSLAGVTAIMIAVCDMVGVEVPAKQELLTLILGVLGLAARDANK